MELTSLLGVCANAQSRSLDGSFQLIENPKMLIPKEIFWARFRMSSY